MRSKLERRQVVEETMRPGGAIGRGYRTGSWVNANQVFNWRKLYHAGLLNEKVHASGLLPVRISEDSHVEYPSVGRLTIAPVVAGVIHIELGRARIRVEGPVDPATLRTILEQLGR
jgi:transposase